MISVHIPFQAPVVAFGHKETSSIEGPLESDEEKPTLYFEKDCLPDNVYYNLYALIDLFVGSVEGMLVR